MQKPAWISSTASLTPLSNARASAAVWNVRPETVKQLAQNISKHQWWWCISLIQLHLVVKILIVQWESLSFTIFQIPRLPMVERGHHSIILEVFLDRTAHHDLGQYYEYCCFTVKKQKQKEATSPFDRWSSCHRWGTHAYMEDHPRGEPDMSVSEFLLSRQYVNSSASGDRIRKQCNQSVYLSPSWKFGFLKMTD